MSKHNRERRQQRRKEGDGNRPLCYVVLHARYSNEDIIDCLRRAREIREKNPKGHIVCVLDGYNEDPRELHQIPEARALAKRAWDHGIGSFLEVTTLLEGFGPLPGKLKEAGIPGAFMGALELWSLAHGKMEDGEPENGIGCRLHGTNEELIQWFNQELCAANKRADELLAGPT